MASTLKEISADGFVTADGVAGLLKSVTLTAGSDAATAVVKEAGSGGTAKLTLKAAANTTASWTAADPRGVYLTDIYVDVTGTGPVCDVEYERAE